VDSSAVPLTVINSDTVVLEHFTIAGNENDTSLVVKNSKVYLNYSILEGIADGDVVNTRSFVESTDQFADYAGGDFSLIPEAAAIDIGVDDAYIDPDFTYSDAGAIYHDQTGYPTDSLVVLYPAEGEVIPVSPDTSATVGLVTEVQLFNEYGRFKTNGTVLWNVGNVGGEFPVGSSSDTDLEGHVTNVYLTNTVAGELNSFMVSSDGVTANSGQFLIEPGVPDSVWVLQQSDTTMTQLDTLEIRAEIFDQFGNPVRDGESVTWSIVPVTGTGDGIFLHANQSVTTGGVAVTYLGTDPQVAALANIGDEVRVEAVSGTGVHRSALVRIVPDDIYNLSMPDDLTADTIAISADANTIEISVAVIDTFGNPLENVEVSWLITSESSDGGSLSSPSSFTDDTGTASVILTTSTVADDRYQVRGWINEGALIAALTATGLDQSSGTSSSEIRQESQVAARGKQDLSLRKGKLINDTGSAISSRRVLSPVKVVGINPLRTVAVDLNAIYDMDDTTAVIMVVPGVTATAELPQDSVDVLLGEKITVTVDAFDQFGNRVADGTPVNWQILPESNNVAVLNQDGVTTEGKASIQLQIADDAEWEFDFKVKSTVEGIEVVSGTYNVDDVTAPAAVGNLTIDPAGWTATNQFTLTWENPPEHSGVAGAYYKIGAEAPVYVAGDDTSHLEISLPSNAAAEVKVWLQDRAGNQDETTAQSVVAKWDDTPPAAFDLVDPLAGWYNQAYLTFSWQASDDAPAGLERYELTIDGTQTYVLHPDSTSYDVPDALSEGQHSWNVTVYDSAGNKTEASNPQTIDVDFTVPSIAHNPVLEATDNTPVTITASFNDPQSGIAIAELYFRKGGESNWQPAVDMKSLPTYQIASSFVRSEGVEYYLRAVDVAGNATYEPAEGAFYSISVTIPSPGLASTNEWPSGIPNGSAVTNYQLISFPATPAKNTPTDVLVDDLGEYDNTVWRFFKYGGNNAWTEFAGISKIKPGEAYFLIVKDPGKNINTGQAYTVETDKPFEITVPAGDWVFFGNPFDFDIPLDNIVINDTMSIVDSPNFYTWKGEWKAPSGLRPWRGYIYKSAEGGKLTIIPRKTAAGGLLAKRGSGEIVLGENEWIVNVTATNGFVKDSGNRIGVLAAASDVYDERDAYEPPMVPGGVSLRINNRDWPENADIYTADFKAINEEGQYWDMEVIAPDDRYNTYVGFKGLQEIPEEFDVWMVDLTLGIAQDLRWKSRYRYAVANPESVHKLRFIAGTKEFVKANSAGVELYPDRYSLSQNYPNPFNPQTSILITLEDAARVDLVVYNLLGQEVYRLADHEYRPAGYHNFIWKGLNQNGERVASGVYFYAARITGLDGKMILKQTRKMVFVK
ncbi:MAG: hypothetical protein GXO92_09005, partial [FCB group bacterium]|nr:hypothetical protein [FCB group bacterium]